MVNYADFDHFTDEQLKLEAKKLGVDIRGNIKRETLIDRIIEASAESLKEEPVAPAIESIKEEVTYQETEKVLRSGQADALIEKIRTHFATQHANGIHRLNPDSLVTYKISSDEKILHMQAIEHPAIKTDILLLQPVTAILKECDTFYRIVSMTKFKQGALETSAPSSPYAPVTLKQ